MTDHPSLEEQVVSCFSPQGELEQSLPYFRARTQQTSLSQEIAKSIQHNRIFVAEAGTGIGKTFAYLVPVLLSQHKTIISTGTKTLQDQLFKRDLPRMRDILKRPVSIALLKGRSNYVCLYHLERNLAANRYHSPQQAKELKKIHLFSARTKTGDKSECHTVDENTASWQMAVSNRDNCLGGECPHISQCFVMIARKAALDAEVVVVNHHLFFADLMLREEGFGELLPNCHTLIFDEAHLVPETASLFFGQSVSTYQLTEFYHDTRNEVLVNAKDCLDLIEQLHEFETSIQQLQLSLIDHKNALSIQALKNHTTFYSAYAHLLASLEKLVDFLETQKSRTEGLLLCFERAQKLFSSLNNWQDQDNKEYIRWLEPRARSLIFQSTPLSIAEKFSTQLSDESQTWIFTSATLAVAGDMNLFCQDLGLTNLKNRLITQVFNSPFDYQQQALMYIPTALPNPNHLDFYPIFSQKIIPLILTAQGRTLVLCTSLKAMDQLFELLQSSLSETEQKFTLLKQGQHTKDQLLAHFRQHPHSVLVASQSFWEGVDIAGDDLSVLIIDRIPFTPPDDPVLTIRLQHLRQQGLNPFEHYQLPQAIISLKQGAGRLIRHENDKGILCIGDKRVAESQYGTTIWKSLPPMQRTRKEARTLQFLANFLKLENFCTK